jgi:hypothetical protein
LALLKDIEMKKFAYAVAGVLALAAVPASAAIVVGSAAPPAGGFQKIDAPVVLVSVGNRTSERNGLDQTKVYGFDEKQSSVVMNDLTVNLGGATTNNGTLAAGTGVASHYVFFDPRGTLRAIGSVTFSQKILGILRTTGGIGDTNSAFGLPTVSYVSVSATGLESSDLITSISNDGKTLNYNWNAANPGDHIRVLTAVPEPATWAFMILGFGLIGGALRSRKANVQTSVRFA